MYCRKCIEKGKTINMIVDAEKKRYVCPKCNHLVNWTTNLSYYDLEEVKK
jgi:transposase-like protein